MHVPQEKLNHPQEDQARPPKIRRCCQIQRQIAAVAPLPSDPGARRPNGRQHFQKVPIREGARKRGIRRDVPVF